MARALRVLIVEDDEDDKVLFSLAVERSRAAVSVHAVRHGQEAIDYLEGCRGFSDRQKFPIPDLIVLDLKMPVLDGFDFLVWHSTSRFCSVPVIVLEGSGDQKEQERALKLGATLVLTKPAAPEQLQCFVEGLSAFDLRRA